ncbi:hypothetical protein AL035_08230 [Salipiger aestuarii]|uniref:Methylglutaconyl-CoA hydratase n=1 Tax=Salipiger aestuarii TaxID=568098 RepID=A0A327Y6R9_9RHOB|nr:hypothetical protein C357_06519 [Citreicella sp. 357]KAA8612899.1 hypothetical protein AL037_07200 [Salipiger aestuarii]KAB2542191.1 hypothetical protein AL035_08230 [Salipiger aestuarii]RAK16838.1 methylglutaconyl-CoA hydratase [Salipiger aestuarii]
MPEAVRLCLLNRCVAAKAPDAAFVAQDDPIFPARRRVRGDKALLNARAGRVGADQMEGAIDAPAARRETDRARDGIAAFVGKRSAPLA